MRDLNRRERLAVAMITGAVENYGELGRSSEDEAAETVMAILARQGIAHDRLQLVLDRAAAGYTDANPLRSPGNERCLALMLRLGADEAAAKAAWAHIHRRGPIRLGDARLG